MALAAAGKHGLVTRERLLADRLTAHQIRHRVRSGALIVEHRGVYRVGHRAPSREATYMAAVLAVGGDALLAGRAAAHLLGLIDGRPPQAEVLTTAKRRVRGLTVRRTRRIERDDRTLWLGIPVTSVPRTIADLGAEDDLVLIFHRAVTRRHARPEQVERVLGRRRNSPHAKAIRKAIWGDSAVLLSALETRFRELLEGARQPLPITNRPAGSKYVDCRWPGHRLTVELDSYRFHKTRHAWEQDYVRAREARGRGDEFRRYTYFDVFEEPEPMLAELSGLLAGPSC